jgi:hypothetical protein
VGVGSGIGVSVGVGVGVAISEGVGVADANGVGVAVPAGVGVAGALGDAGLADSEGRGVDGRGVSPGRMGCGAGGADAPGACVGRGVAVGSDDDGAATVAAGLGGCEDSPVPPSTAWTGLSPALASTLSASRCTSIIRQPASPMSPAATVTPAKAAASRPARRTAVTGRPAFPTSNGGMGARPGSTAVSRSIALIRAVQAAQSEA